MSRWMTGCALALPLGPTAPAACSLLSASPFPGAPCERSAQAACAAVARCPLRSACQRRGMVRYGPLRPSGGCRGATCGATPSKATHPDTLAPPAGSSPGAPRLSSVARGRTSQCRAASRHLPLAPALALVRSSPAARVASVRFVRAAYQSLPPLPIVSDVVKILTKIMAAMSHAAIRRKSPSMAN